MNKLKIFDYITVGRATSLQLEMLSNPYLSAYDRTEVRNALEQLTVRSPAFLVRLMQEAKGKPELCQALAPVVRTVFLRTKDDLVRDYLRKCATGLGFANEVKSVPPTSPFTKAQLNALRYLQAMADTYFSGETHGPLQLRLNPLIVGPSGVGKSHLVRELGDRLNLPTLRLTVGEWLINGAAQQPTTFHVLQQFIEKHERFILHLDELDKFRNDGSAHWQNSLMTELLGTIDRRIHASGTKDVPWTPAHSDRLLNNVFVLGSGTWQSLWSSQVAGANDPASVVRRIRESRVIPEELTNRFNSSFLVLPGYTVEEFKRMGERFGFGSADYDAEEAVRSGLNMRFFEGLATRLAIQRRLSA